MIDLCPVGALTSKPFRFQARAWELTQRRHDRAARLRRLQPVRARPPQPRPAGRAARERGGQRGWISDRDRFSCTGLRRRPPRAADDQAQRDLAGGRLGGPRSRRAAKSLEAAGAELRTLGSSGATLEELYLAQKLTRGLGSPHVDHRLQPDRLPRRRGGPGAALARADAGEPRAERRDPPGRLQRPQGPAADRSPAAQVDPARRPRSVPQSGRLRLQLPRWPPACIVGPGHARRAGRCRGSSA